MPDEQYEAGRRDGRLDSLEQSFSEHKQSTSKEFSEIWKIQKSQERIMWMMIGAFGLMQVLPQIKGFLS